MKFRRLGPEEIIAAGDVFANVDMNEFIKDGVLNPDMARCPFFVTTSIGNRAKYINTINFKVWRLGAETNLNSLIYEDMLE